MSNCRNANESRRRFLMLVGGSALAVPVASLTGCSGEESPAPAKPEAMPESAGGMTEAAEAVEEVMEEAAAEAPAATAELPQLSEDDPTAVSLGYVHDATTVDTAKYARYEAGQQCSNCALFQGDGEWAGCSIFPGKAVKATGWCSVYAPKAG